MTEAERVPVSDAGHPGAQDPNAGAKLHKAPNAFRTISEVADDLHIPQHVLRFWETKFSQVKPLKRGGGRRYYRPDDIALLRRISNLLYTQGYTIKGVQRLLREGGELPDEAPEPPVAEVPAVSDEREEKAEGPQLPIPDLTPVARVIVRPKAEPKGESQARVLRALLERTVHELEEIQALLLA